MPKVVWLDSDRDYITQTIPRRDLHENRQRPDANQVDAAKKSRLGRSR